MLEQFGLTEKGLDVALMVKEDYRMHRPICLPGEETPRILAPEYLLSRTMDLKGLGEPLALAMMASRDPEFPMALAAVARLSPVASRIKLVSEVISVVGETTRHDLVRKCVDLIKKAAFDPQAIDVVRVQTSRFIVRTRTQYTSALRQNLEGLLEGSVAPRVFVKDFFELTEAGNIRNQIREKMMVGLLLSKTIRPSIKFLVLENFHRFSEPIRRGIVSKIMQAKPGHHVDMVKEELEWIVGHENPVRKVH
jgi:hypothetical protein